MRGIVALVMCWFMVPVAALAASVPALDLLDAKIPYQADFYLRGDAGTYDGKVWHVAGKHRREVMTAKGPQIFLFRRDTDQAFILYPERKWYVGAGFQSLGALIGGVETMRVERDKGTADTIEGMAATRYDTNATSSGGGYFEGKSWISKEGILLKIAGVVRYDGRDLWVETGLRNVRRVGSDSSLFELPKDYKGLNLTGLDLGKMGPQLQMLRKSVIE